MSRPNVVDCPFVSVLRRLFAVVFCAALLLGFAVAQDSAAVSSSAVPNIVRFSGTIPASPTGTVGVIFALYAEQSGGAQSKQFRHRKSAMPTNAERFYKQLSSLRALKALVGMPEDATLIASGQRGKTTRDGLSPKPPAASPMRRARSSSSGSRIPAALQKI
jgi:hypothetical protein